MKISESKLCLALNEFIEREVMPLGSNMDLTKQFLYGVKIGVVKRKIQGLVKSYVNKPEVKMLNLVDEEKGLIDIEPIYQSAIDAMRQMGSFELDDIKFNEADLQTLYGILQKYASQEVSL